MTGNVLHTGQAPVGRNNCALKFVLNPAERGDKVLVCLYWCTIVPSFFSAASEAYSVGVGPILP